MQNLHFRLRGLATMHEVEAKFRVDSHEPVRARLRALGATREGRVREHNLIYDAPDGSMQRRGCGLRVRESTADDDHGAKSTTLTFKGATTASEFKRREELEVAVSHADVMATMLERLGYVVILDYEKYRESWTLSGCRVELDEPPNIGLFVEIEGPDETTIRKVQESLELGGHEHVSQSYVRMLMSGSRQ